MKHAVKVSDDSDSHESGETNCLAEVRQLVGASQIHLAHAFEDEVPPRFAARYILRIVAQKRHILKLADMARCG
jgi:hypothetical protein